jgi:hypothetical protein
LEYVTFDRPGLGGVITMVRPLSIAIALCWMASVPARADIVYTFFTDDSHPPGDIYPPATLTGSFTTDAGGNLVGYDFVFNAAEEYTPLNSSAELSNSTFTASYPVNGGEALTLQISFGGNLTTVDSQYFNLSFIPALNFSYAVGFGFGHWEVGTSVPEPSSIALLGSTCLVSVGVAIASRLRRRGSKSSTPAMTQ